MHNAHEYMIILILNINNIRCLFYHPPLPILQIAHALLSGQIQRTYTNNYATL